MPRWRKATWAVVLWTALFAVWIVAGVGNTGGNCAGMTGDELAACQAGTAIGAGLGVSFLIMLWFIGFIVLAVIWFASRPNNNVVVYGPQGQQVSLSEKDAKRRVERDGWTYQPRQ